MQYTLDLDGGLDRQGSHSVMQKPGICIVRIYVGEEA